MSELNKANNTSIFFDEILANFRPFILLKKVFHYRTSFLTDKAINDHCPYVTKCYIGVEIGIKADRIYLDFKSSILEPLRNRSSIQQYKYRFMTA